MMAKSSRIRRRLMLYFASGFLVYSLVLGIVFVVLFSLSHTATHRAELERRSTQIAQTLSQYATDGTLDVSASPGAAGRGSGMGANHQPGYGAYLRLLDDIAMTEVWVVDKDLNQIVRNHGQTTLSYQDLPAGADEVIRQAMEGKTTFTNSFDAFLPAPMLTVATPVLGADGEAIGAVLLHERVDAESALTNRTFLILSISMGAAILLAIIATRLLAQRFTQPLAKMKAAALRVSQGDYSAKTEVSLRDEIGELASALDDMTSKLDDSARQTAQFEQRRRDLMATISHELRTPVTVIRGSMEALCDKVVVEPAKVEQYHRQILAETLFLERLVSDLLELARLQNPEFVIEMAPVDVVGFVGGAVRGLQHLAAGKQIDLRYAVVGELAPIVDGDYSRLRQMIVAVLDNAIKFSPAGS
ncbi:MAG: HAMP domain-containing protein, partial [Propionibacteriaceae bacterium]|nr:HAMP domain-containing protein [Propionibacteriaceae bacterium]